ncbi:MAG: SagB family peptide dehydrogenase [Candidatus Hodarchaeota archaeon]
MVKEITTVQKVEFLLLIAIFLGSFILLFFQIVLSPKYDKSLPAADLVGHLPLSAAIQQPTITNDLGDHPLEIREISQILWALQGITHGVNKRTVPSAGATYPLEIFLVHKGSSTLKKGQYKYSPQYHKLKLISSSSNWSELLLSFLDDDYKAISNVSTVFLILTDYSRTTNIYSSNHSLYAYRGIQYVHLEVGHAIQNFQLQLASLNLKSRIIFNFTSQIIKDFLDSTLDPMVVLPVGIDRVSSPSPLRLKQNLSCNKEEMTVEQAIAKRKSVRDYLDGKIPLMVILNILNDSINIPYLTKDNLHLDFRFVAGEIGGLSNGSYRFQLENHTLTLIELGDFRTELREAGLNQIMIEKAQCDIVISVNTTWIKEQLDPLLYHRIMMYNIGMLAQNIYLKCAAYGLGTVVVGALYEGKTSRVIDIPNTHTPIYIIPIGLTPEFFENKSIIYIPLTNLARNIGLLSYIPFYFCLYLSLPILRQRISKKMRWIHCLSGIIPLLGVFFHFMVIHGHVRDLWDFINLNSYFSALIRFVTKILLFPITRYDIGIYLANLNILLGFSAGVTGIIVGFKIIKNKKLVKKIHKYSIFGIIFFMIIHVLLNRTMVVIDPIVFLLLNVLTIDLFFIIYLYPKLATDIFKRKKTTSSLFP